MSQILPWVISILQSIVLGRILTDWLIKKGVNLFPSSHLWVPSFGADLGIAKSRDILEFFFFIIFLFVSFLITRRLRFSIYTAVAHTLALVVIYLQVSFVDYAGLTAIFYLIFLNILFLFISFLVKDQSKKPPLFVYANGFLAGFYLLILSRFLTPSVGISLSLLLITPLIYASLYSKFSKFLTHPAHSILALVAFFPFNNFAVIAIGLTSLLLTKVKVNKSIFSFHQNWGVWLVVFFILAYNPLYYLGTFDSIEEGFWVGWLQRFLSGQIIYKDYAAYHPPLFLWGLGIFSKLVSPSLANTRLYFHLLQVLGLGIISLTTVYLLESKLLKFLTIFIIFAFGSYLVRNNMEIRLALGLIPLLFIYLSQKYPKRKNLFQFSIGVAIVFSIMSSLEVGLASLVAVFVTSFFLKSFFYVFLGFLVSGGLIFTRFVLSGAAAPALEQLSFYMNAFSSGYLNSALARPANFTLLHWFDVDKFLGNSGFLWEISIFALGLGILYFLSIFRKKDKNPKQILTIGLTVFALALVRSVLGRSDVYHIKFLWLITLIILNYVLEQVFPKNLLVYTAVFLIISFVIGREATQIALMQTQVIKFQTYGNPSGQYPFYETSRAGILAGVEVDTKSFDNLISYIQNSVDKNEKIFVFPQGPEIYFLADRENSTSFDTPLAFFTEKYQDQMISEIESSPPKLVIYNPKTNVGNLVAGSLGKVNDYIKENFEPISSFGDFQVLKRL